jgi:hypothetical protein
VLRQDHLEQLRANRVAPPSDIEGKLRCQRANAPEYQCAAGVIGSTWFKRLSCRGDNGTVAGLTTKPRAPSRTGSSASSTAAYEPTLSTTSTSPGTTN